MDVHLFLPKCLLKAWVPGPSCTHDWYRVEWDWQVGPVRPKPVLPAWMAFNASFWQTYFSNEPVLKKLILQFFSLNFADILMTVRRLSLIRVSLCVYSGKAAFCVDTYEHNSKFTDETCTDCYLRMDSSSNPIYFLNSTPTHALKTINLYSIVP